MQQSPTLEQSQPLASRRAQIWLVSAAVALYWISLYLYVPTLPVYAEDRIGNLEMVGVVLSMYGLWQAVVRLPLGIVADWVGRRKPFILLGFALSALGAWMMATSDSYLGLLLGRGVTGLSAAAWVPLAVLFAGLFPPKDAVRAAGLLSLVNLGSRIFATSINGKLNDWGGYSLAFFLAMGVAAAAALVTLPVHEKPRAPRPPSLKTTGALIVRSDVLLPAVLAAVGQYIAWASVFGFVPILARNLGASDTVVSMMVSLNLLVSMGGNLITTTFGKRIGNVRLVYASYAMMAVGMGVAAVAGSLWVVILAQAFIGLGGGIGSPITMGLSIEKVDDESRATAMGLHQAVYAIGMFAGPWLSGILADSMGIQPMFGVTAAAGLVLSLLMTRVMEKGR